MKSKSVDKIVKDKDQKQKPKQEKKQELKQVKDVVPAKK